MAANPGKETIGAHANCASELNTSMAELFLFPDGVIVCVYINLGNEGFPIGVPPFQFTNCFFESEEKDATHSVKHITRVPLAGQPRHTRVFIFSSERTHFTCAVHLKAVLSLSLPSMARDSVGSPYKQSLSSASFAPLLHLPLLLSRASRSRDEPCLLVFFFEFFRLRFCFGR